MTKIKLPLNFYSIFFYPEKIDFNIIEYLNCSDLRLGILCIFYYKDDVVYYI